MDTNHELKPTKEKAKETEKTTGNKLQEKEKIT
jgi:hypothetical protein